MKDIKYMIFAVSINFRMVGTVYTVQYMSASKLL